MVTKFVRKLLFLARFAPDDPDKIPHYDPEWGNSPEYHFQLYHALASTGVKVVCAQTPSKLIEMNDQIDFVYSIFNRANFRNSEIFVSSLCAFLKLPYLGGHPNARAVAEDKHLFKLLAWRLNILTPKWIKIDEWDDLDTLSQLKLPCIVKWRFGADSAGISSDSVARDHETLVKLVQQAQTNKTPVIVEEFIFGENITIGAIGAAECEVFRPIRITTGKSWNIQTYREKKFGDGNRKKTIIDEPKIIKRMTEIVHQLYAELRPLDYFRVDFRRSAKDGSLHLLELNAVCNLHPQSTFALSARDQYPEYNELVRHILTESLDRQGLALE